MWNDILANYASLNIIMCIIILLMGCLFATINDGLPEVGLAWLNPKWIYEHIKVNWFGAVFLALIANAIVLPCAVCYWFYKLCTVGRR